ncbi:MAG: O-antigen ligase family protein [Bacteroidia bacterium]|nr:O-antigen ligase family protein [Methylotenera sp.]
MHQLLIFLAIFSCFSIALPTAFMSIAMGLFVLVWLISGNYVEKIKLIFRNPVAIIAIALFCLYGIGMFYSNAPWGMRFNWWLKYHKLLYIPLIISVLTNKINRDYAIQAFIGGMLMVLIISYLKWLSIVPHTDIGQGYFVFKGRIAHNILMAFAVYLMLKLTVQTAKPYCWIWAIATILGILNIFILVNGRTGQIILLVLCFWFCWEIWQKKSIKYLLAGTVALVIIFFVVPKANDFRLMQITQEIANHKPNEAQTSSGTRLEFYTNSLTLIKRNPLFGAGTGSFEFEYKQLAETQKTLATYVPNPHNEFLLTWQELGLLGLFLLIILFASQWKASYFILKDSKHSMVEGYALRGLILTMTVGCLFNSLLLDAGEGKFYCVLSGVLLSAYQRSKH